MKDSSEKPPEPSARASQSVAVSAAIIAFGTLISRVLGLVRDMVLAAVFPLMVKDAWVVAFRLPNLFRRLLGEGSLSVAFIPVFVEILTQKKGQTGPVPEAQRLVHGVFTLLFIILCTLTTLGVVWIEPLMGLLVSGKGYMSIPGKFELTVKLGRIMFSFIFLMSTYAYFMAILNSLHQFALAALAPAFLNIIIIISSLLSYVWDETSGVTISWGVLLGGAVQMGVLIPPLYRAGYLPKLTRQIVSPEIRRVFHSILPSLLGMGILQLTGLINIQFASRLPQGAHTWIYFADRILELPLSLFAVSLGSALLPTLSSYWSSGLREKMGATANHYLRLIFYITIPAAVGVYLLAEPIVEVLFMRGRFSAHDVEQTANVLRVYAMVLITTSAVRIMTTSFYAIKNTWLPAAAAGVALAGHILAATILIEKMGLPGLPLATVVSSGLNVLLLIVAYRWLIGPLFVKQLLWGLFKFSLAAALMGAVTQIYTLLLRIVDQPTQWTRFLALMITLFASMLTYGLGSHLLRIQEYQVTVGAYWGRLQRLSWFKR